MTKHESPIPIPSPSIPGAYERDTVMWHQPGEMGGRFNGENTPSTDASVLMDESVREEHRLEGGGGEHGKYRKDKRIIHGPGASDFTTAQGGTDFPESGNEKGTGQLRNDDSPTSESRVTPELEVEQNSSDDKPTL